MSTLVIRLSVAYLARLIVPPLFCTVCSRALPWCICSWKDGQR